MDRYMEKSKIKKLEKLLYIFKSKVIKFILNLDIKKDNNKSYIEGIGSVIHINRPPFDWEELTAEKNNQHIEICEKYQKIIEPFEGILAYAPERIYKMYEDAKEKFEVWVFLKDNYKLTNNPMENEKNFLNSVKKLEDIIRLFHNKPELIVIPDTNALFIEPDPAKYKEVIGEDTFTFMLLPTVISELDKLKTKDEKIGEKSKKLIKRIKGWRKQGSITDGITIDKTITLKAEVSKQIFSNMPSVLDIDNNDDRIIINILDIQNRFPSASVILISRDINMQNKAELMMLECIDIEFFKEENKNKL